MALLPAAAPIADPRTWSPQVTAKTSSEVDSVTFSPDGTVVATDTDDGCVQLWSAGTGRLVHLLLDRDSGFGALKFSPDGTTLATLTARENPPEKRIQRWSVRIGQLITVTDVIDYTGFHAGGGWLATGDKESGARIWDISSGRLVTALSEIRDLHYFDSDPHRLVTVQNGWALLWNTVGPLLVARLVRTDDSAGNTGFSPDGRRVYTVGHDGTARLWDAATGRAIADLGHIDSDVDFADPGRTVTVRGDGAAGGGCGTPRTVASLRRRTRPSGWPPLTAGRWSPKHQDSRNNSGAPRRAGRSQPSAPSTGAGTAAMAAGC